MINISVILTFIVNKNGKYKIKYNYCLYNDLKQR